MFYLYQKIDFILYYHINFRINIILFKCHFTKFYLIIINFIQSFSLFILINVESKLSNNYFYQSNYFV